MMTDGAEADKALKSREAFVARVRRITFGALSLAMVASLILFSSEVTIGLGIGGLLAVANFQGLFALINQLLGSRAKRKAFYFLLFLAKLLLLAVATYLLVVYVPMNLVSFMVGLSILFVVLMVESYRRMSSDTGDVQCSHS